LKEVNEGMYRIIGKLLRLVGILYVLVRRRGD